MAGTESTAAQNGSNPSVAATASSADGEAKPAPFFGSRLKGLWRFTELYYMANFLLLISYPAARYYIVNVAQFSYKRLVFNSYELVEWEQHAFSLLGIVMAVKAWKMLSADSFLADFFLYAKTVLAALTYASDIRIFCYYIIAMGVIFLIAQQPCYNGPDKITYFTPGTFKWEVQENHKGVTWLVELYAPWSPPCIYLEPVFADLSLKYTTSKLKFGKLDLGRWPKAAPELKVDVSGVTEQLPTIIMFENGEEVGRIPHVFKDGSFAKGKFKRTDVIRAFDLDGQYARTVGQDSAKAPISSADKKSKKNK